MPFSHIEKCDMLETYLMCKKNCVAAVRRYSELFPGRQVPYRLYFLRLYRQFRRNENVFVKKRTKKTYIISEEMEVTVLTYFEVHPTNSIRQLSRESGISFTNIQRILKKHKYSPYKFQPVHTLEDGDARRRLEFCVWFIRKCTEDRSFSRQVLWSDETNFSNRGMYNKKNDHYWSTENPLLVQQRNPQRRFSINIWCGLIGSTIVGPYFYHGTLTGQRYIEFLIPLLEEFLDNVDLETRPNIYFQQDGAPAHNYRAVPALLQTLFGDRWIATHGSVRFPPRSPDITPLDFYFWGYVKNEAYKARYNTENDLQNAIRNIINSIDGRVVFNATRSVLKRAQKCVEIGGDVFEHLL